MLMRACDIHNKKVIEKQLNKSKEWASKRDVMLKISGKGNNIRVEAAPRNIKEPGKAFGILQAIVNKINKEFFGGEQFMDNVKGGDDYKYTNLLLTKEALDKIQEKSKKRYKGSENKSERITPEEFNEIFPETEGNAYNVDGDIQSSVDNPNKDIFFNINKIDKNRKKVNTRLNSFLKNILSNLYVEDSKGEKKPIEFKTLEQFKNWYESKKNKKFDGLGAAMILDGIYTATEEDGITLPEEAMHFIIEVIYNQPEVQELLTLKDANGIRLLETTTAYQESYRIYYDKYRGDPQVSGKVDKEILAKLVAQYLYDTREVNSNFNKLKRAFDAFIRVFNRSYKGIGKQLSDENYPIELRKRLGLISENLDRNKYISDVNQHLVQVSPTSIEVYKSSPSDNLTSIRTQLDNMKKRIEQLIKTSPVTGQDWENYKKSFWASGIQEAADDNVSNLTLERIGKHKQKLLDLLKTVPGDATYQQQLVETQSLEKYFNIFDKNRADVFQLYSIEARIGKINKSISLKEYEEGLNFFLFGTGNLKGTTAANIDYNQYGAIFDMFKAYSKVVTFTGEVKGSEGLTDPNNNLLSMVRPEHIAEIKEIHDIYSPIIHLIEREYVEKGNQLFANDPVRNKRVGEALQRLNLYSTALRNFLDNNDVHHHARNNIEIETFRLIGREDLIENITGKSLSRVFTDLSVIKRYQGLYHNAKEEWMRTFQMKIETISDRIRMLTVKDVKSLYDELMSLGYNDLGPREVVKVFYQSDAKGRQTHYVNTERDIAKWAKDKEEFTKQIPALLSRFAINNGFSIIVADDYVKLMKQFAPIYGLEQEDRQKLPKNLQELWKVRDHYSELWGNWHAANTEQFSTQEADDFLADAKKKLSLFHYRKLEEASIKEYTRYDGSVVSYYTGALTRPKAINPSYTRLSAKEKRLADAYAKALKDKKLTDNPERYNFENLARMPQISAELLDAMTGGGRRATIKDRIKGVFVERIDDDVYNSTEDGVVIKFPPERYNKKLDDPELLSNDVIKSFAIYTANINHRKQFIPEILELQGMIDMVSKGQVSSPDYAYLPDEIKSLRSGAGSNLELAMKNLLESVVYKDKIHRGFATTFLDNTKRYVTKLNLSYNLPAMVTSWMSGELDKAMAAKLGDMITMEEYKTGQKKFAKDLPSIMKDFENPEKSTILGALSVAMGIGNSVTENYSYTSYNRGVRMIVGTVKPFSGWNTLELLQSLPVLATVGESIREVDGIWYTRQAYEAKFFKVPPGTTDKKKYVEGQKKKWREGKSFMDSVEVVKGELIFKDIAQNMVDLYMLRARAIVSEMSQQYTSDSYKGELHRTAALNLILGTHSTWLQLAMDKMFGAKRLNLLTGQTEIGYYRGEVFNYFRGVLAQGAADIWSSLKNSTFDMKEFRFMLNYDLNVDEQHNIRAVKRIAAHMGLITVIGLITYILNGIALGDDDDEELSVGLQLAALLLTKVSIEQNAKLSLKDIYEIANNPMIHFDSGFKRFQILDALYQSLSKDSEEWDIYTTDSIFKGMPKWQVNMIRSTPYLKGIFENYAGWFLNPKLGGSLEGEFSDSARNFKQKKNALKSFVLEPTQTGEVIRTFIDGYGIPAKIIGYNLGRAGLYMFDSPYYNNSGIFKNKLPSKKAQKLNDE